MTKRFGMYLVAVLILCSLPAPAPLFGQTGPDYKVYAVEYASIPEWDVTGMLLGAEAPVVADGSMMVWLIKDPDGRNILVDTGCRPDHPNLSNSQARERYIRPDEAVAKVGVGPENITDIIVTHLHWDHADGVSLFPNAHIWIQKAELEYYATSAWQEGGDHRGVDPRNVTELVELNTAGRVTLVDGDDQGDIPGNPDIHGWAPFVCIPVPRRRLPRDGTVILASDNVWFYANLKKNLANSLTFDPEAQLKAQDRMRGLASKPDWIIPGHDGAVFGEVS